MSKIKVLMADNSPDDIDTLIAVLSTDPELEIVGVATTGNRAINLVSNLKPDIVLISESLQNVNTLEAIKQIMAYNPTPILMLIDPCYESRKGDIFKATSIGALDVIEKPVIIRNRQNGFEKCFSYDKLKSVELVETVKLLSKIKVVTHLAGKLENNRRSQSVRQSTLQYRHEAHFGFHKSNKLVAIGASTGGPSALAVVLRGLPGHLKIGIVIVQHVAEGFSAGLAQWLDKESEMTVKEAKDGDLIELGCAFLAPTGYHMMVAGRNRITLNKTPLVSGHRPSADVLFTSVAKRYGPDSIGVILTGMGADGAKGITAMRDADGKTIAQDEQSCVVFGMPKAAIQTGNVDEILPLDSIAERITRLCMTR